MFFRRLIVLPDADQRVIDTVLKNSGNQQLEIIKVEDALDAFDSLERAYKEAKETLVLRARKTSFIKQFSSIPKGTVCTRFYQFTPELGCSFACHYCYLEKTLRYPHLMLPTHFTNYDRMLRDIEKTINKKKSPLLFNMGELADSRAWDHITEFSKVIVPFIANTKNGYLYMLSKSGNYKNFIGLKHRDKQGRSRVIQVASVNAPIVCELIEEKTASLEDRIHAMQKLQEDGYKIRYRIDPIMPFGELFYDGLITEDEHFRKTTDMYEPMLDMIFSMTSLELITLGTYRPYPGLQHYLSKRFPNSCVLGIKTQREGSKEHINKRFRIRVYTWFKSEIQRRSSQTKVALCKEAPEIWKAVGLSFKPLRCSCTL